MLHDNVKGRKPRLPLLQGGPGDADKRGKAAIHRNGS
ncbi:hypothetical protein HBDW_13200 [Herbaspirillum sp. DW155]|nr:hypothetical protein HBDW_13200 [Herbaspirillum sp. DW155]